MDASVDGDEPYKAEDLPCQWPLHFDEAIRQINDRIQPISRRSPRELLFGLAITPEHKTTPETVINPHIDALTETSLDDLLRSLAMNIEENMAMAEMLRMRAYLLQLEIAAHHKSLWDARTPAVQFSIGDLVQRYDSARDGNYKTVNKLAPRWSTPHIISGKSLNFYTLSRIPTPETETEEQQYDLPDTEDRIQDDVFPPFTDMEPL